MKTLRNVVIVAASRTPFGTFMGSLKDVPATRLGSIAIADALKKSSIDINLVDEVIMGNVLPANEGQAPARQAALGAGLPIHVQCLTINKVCGSGLKAVMLASQAIMVGDADVVVAGGMENMSQAPFYVPKLRNGQKMGHTELIDGMIKDGLWDVYNDFHMGNAAELCARTCDVPRDSQDELAIKSFERALDAQKKGLFKDEIVPVTVPQRRGDDLVVAEDEGPKRVNFEKLKKLRPAFEKDGTVTAANSSSINDGAAALVLMAEETAEKLNIKPLAKVLTQSSAARAPEEFPIAPNDSIVKALEKAGLTVDDIDLFEINEAFAVVTLINNRLLNLPLEKVNVNGGAIALGHPIGASGARILVTLLHAMRQRSAKRGLASICIGGGEASTLIVENL